MSCSNVKWNFVDRATRSVMVYTKCGRGVGGGGGGESGALPYWPIRVSYRYTIGIIYDVPTPIRVCAAEQGNMVFKV